MSQWSKIEAGSGPCRQMMENREMKGKVMWRINEHWQGKCQGIDKEEGQSVVHWWMSRGNGGRRKSCNTHDPHGYHVTFLILCGTFPTCSDSHVYHAAVYKSCSLGTYSPSNLLNFHPTNPSLFSLCCFLLICLKIYLVAWIVWSNTKQLKSLVNST